jgi:hypothetical protein
MFPKLVEYIPSTIITKEVYYHIHNIYKYIKSGDLQMNNIVHIVSTMDYILQKEQRLDFNIVLLQKAIEDQNKELVTVFSCVFLILS